MTTLPSVNDLTDPNSQYFKANAFAIRPGETSDQYNARVAPLKTAAPAAPIPPDYSAAAKSAGQAGFGAGDYASLLGSTPEEQTAAKDAIAKQFGYDSADAFFTDAFQKPSQTTEHFYNDAYAAAGLDKITSSITSKKDMLNKALGVVNDNPWLDEASRTGRAKRLQELATGDIQSLLDEYNLKLGKVHDLVTSHASDLGADEKTRNARLAYLESAAKDKAATLGSDRARTYLSDYATAKASTAKPQTVSVGKSSVLYQWNPVNQDFEPVASGANAHTTTPAKAPSVSPQQKLLDKFSTDLSKINPKTETREALLSRLITKYGSQIDPGDITRKVFETYPDGWEARYKTN